MSSQRVVVVGGGIAGLTAAFTLAEHQQGRRAPPDVRVLEASPRPGGHARTLDDSGFIVEGGPNGFLDREPETLTLVQELGLESRLVEARPESKRRFIVRGGRLCRVPESPPALVTSDALTLRGKLRLLGEPFARKAPEDVDETVFEFAARRIGREAAEMLVDAAVSGISAGDSRALSVKAQFPLMIEMERDHGSLIKAMIARRKRGTGPSRLLSFDRGMSTLTGAIGQRLGGRVHTGVGVGSLERCARGWQLVTTDGETIEADRVVLAVAARVAAGLLRGLDSTMSCLLDEIAYSGVNLVGLAYRVDDVPRALDGYGYLVTRPEQMATLGVVWESSLFPGRAPDGFALLRVFLGGARRPDVVAYDEQAAIDLARTELTRIMGIRQPPSRAWVFRWPDAIAQYTVGHLERVAAIRDRLLLHDGLELCGASYDGVSFNHAIVSGRRVGRIVAAQLDADDERLTTRGHTIGESWQGSSAAHKALAGFG